MLSALLNKTFPIPIPILYYGKNITFDILLDNKVMQSMAQMIQHGESGIVSHLLDLFK